MNFRVALLLLLITTLIDEIFTLECTKDPANCIDIINEIDRMPSNNYEFTKDCQLSERVVSCFERAGCSDTAGVVSDWYRTTNLICKDDCHKVYECGDEFIKRNNMSCESLDSFYNCLNQGSQGCTFEIVIGMVKTLQDIAITCEDEGFVWSKKRGCREDMKHTFGYKAEQGNFRNVLVWQCVWCPESKKPKQDHGWNFPILRESCGYNYETVYSKAIKTYQGPLVLVMLLFSLPVYLMLLQPTPFYLLS